uniref:Uncharacterized protein n=1 Tax=Anopheles epiroticus TaxID=199890 RepID=A0A182PSB7_9DIPT
MMIAVDVITRNAKNENPATETNGTVVASETIEIAIAIDEIIEIIRNDWIALIIVSETVIVDAVGMVAKSNRNDHRDRDRSRSRSY